MSLPLVQGVKAHFPESRTTLIVKKELSDLWKDQPGADEIVEWDPDLERPSKLLGIIKKHDFDLSFLLATSREIASIHADAGIPMRVGCDFWGRKSFLTHFLPTNGFPTDPELVRRHMVRNYLNLSRLVSIRPRFVRPQLALDGERRPRY